MNPRRYSKLTQQQRRRLRNEYVRFQKGKCMYCNALLSGPPPKWVTDRPIDLTLYRPGFLQHPIHLQHCHKTDRTEGAVHAYCNAVLWEYEKR